MRRRASSKRTATSRRRAWGTVIERLEPRQMMAADLVISEFLARNDTGMVDADGERPDWIEIHNPTSAAVDLGGWYLTDKADDLTKWRFPSRSIDAGEYLVVFASNKNRREEELHTNFKLTAGGEFLALVYDEPDPTIVQQFAPEFPQQLSDVSYGVSIASSPLPLLSTGATAEVLVPADDSLGLDWTLRGFLPNVAWSALPTGVGYDEVSGAAGEIGGEIASDLGDLMHDVNSAIYLRLPFTVDDPSALQTLQLRMKYDAGFVALLNGLEVARENAPAIENLRFDSVASQERSDSQAVVFQTLDITADLDLLVPGTNVLSIVGLNSSAADADFLIVPELLATVSTIDVDSPRYFSTPTPGEPNSAGAVDLGPIFSGLTHTPSQPGVGDAIIVTAAVAPSFDPIAAVALHYRVMFAAEVTMAMRDDGQGADAAAGDGIFTAIIPAGIASPSEMIRWRVTASDVRATLTRAPALAEPTNSPEYFGTVVLDASIDTQLPMLHWFVQNTSAANTRTGTRASVYFEGEFYDNVFIRIRGGSTTRTNRPSHKIEFNDGHHFRWQAGERRVDEFNLNTNLTDKAYLRQALAFETLAAAGVPSPAAFLTRVNRNGVFYGLDTWIEQMDRDFLRRVDLDPDGALYKMFNRADSADQAEKKTRKDEDRSDLQDLIAGINSFGAGRLTYLLDNVNIPELITYMAANTIISDRDHGTKNYYFYRDTEGDGLWQILPWDKDLTFGRNWHGGLFQDIVTFDNSPVDVSWNRLLAAVYETPLLREMYLRRLRTLMDEMLQPPDTPADQLKFEQRLDELVELAADDASDDFDRWATGNFGGSSGWTWGDPFRQMADAVELIKTRYLAGRRDFLYNRHTIGAGPLSEGIPDEQLDLAARPAAERGISFATIEFNPVSGNQDEEYIEIVNSNDVAIDISGWKLSGWKLSGGVEHTFQPGLVIPAGETLYVTPDAKVFRARTDGPSGGQNLLIEGGYQGQLSARGETLQLFDASGRMIVEKTYAGSPSLAQQFLRLSELMFHPARNNAGRDGDDFEFIELVNTGPSALDLAGVQFTGGVQFSFDELSLPAGERLVLVKNPLAFAQRYDTTNMIVVGPYTSGTLDNGGERIKLLDAANEEIVDFRYDDDWFPITDGEGFSLTLVDESVDVDLLSEANVWRPSSFLGGSPGTDDAGLTPLPGAILVNEVLAHTDDFIFGDRIELVNVTDEPINIGSWLLSDDPSRPSKYVIAPGTTIPAGGFVVFNQLTHFDNPADPGVRVPFALSELGDEVVLSAALGDGTPLGFRTIRRFGATENSVALGRHIKSDGGDDFVAMVQPTFGQPNALPSVGPVVIHEIMFNPADDSLEYVELRNITGAAVSLIGWTLEGIGFEFLQGATIEAGSLALVVPIDPQNFRAMNNVPAGTPIFGPYTGSLDNGGEKLVLTKPGAPEPNMTIPRIEVDRVRYNDKAPWPIEADGGGASLQRLDATAYGSDPINWRASQGGGTPGSFPTRVIDVLLGGSTWSSEFLAHAGADGVSLAGDVGNIPWVNVDQIRIRFDSGVIITADDLVVRGVNRSQYEMVGFDYDAIEHLATWTLAAPVRADKLLVELSDRVTDLAGRPIDAGSSDPGAPLPSGNGVIEAGEMFSIRVDVLPADVDATDHVNRADLLGVLRHLSPSTGAAYRAKFDLNADGAIDVGDLRAVLLRFGSRLPNGEPAPADNTPAAVAADTVFTRLGKAQQPAALHAAGGEPTKASGNLASRATPSERLGRRTLRRTAFARHITASAVDLALTSDDPIRRRARRE